ncbi:MAG: T9SS type A sorting domain-containing protein [Bacteroidota bacterium]
MKTILQRLALFTLLFAGALSGFSQSGNGTCQIDITDPLNVTVETETRVIQTFSPECSGALTALSVKLKNPFGSDTPMNVQLLDGDGTVLASINGKILPADYDDYVDMVFAVPVNLTAGAAYRFSITGSRIIFIWRTENTTALANQNRMQFPDYGSSYTTQSTIFKVSVTDSDPRLITDSVGGSDNRTVAVPVRVKNFNNFSTLQGNIDFGTASVAAIDSVVATSLLTGDAHIDGSTRIFAGNVFTFSYDKDNGYFELPDSSILFTAYLRLADIEDSNGNTCATPTVNSDYTPVQFGRLENNVPVSIVPQTTFGKVCVKLQTITIGETGLACPSSPGFVVPFTTQGFSSGDNFNLYITEISATEPVATATYGDTAFIIEGSLPASGEFTLRAAWTGGDIEDTEVITLVDVTTYPYDANVAMNGDYTNYLEAGNTYVSCSVNPTKIEVIGSGTGYSYTYSDDTNTASGSGEHTAGDSILVPVFGNNGTFTVSITTTNVLGCINPEPFTFKVHGDQEKPFFTLKNEHANVITFYYSGTQTLSVDPTLLFDHFEDNCSDSVNLTALVQDDAGNAITGTTEFTPGDHILVFSLTDEAENTYADTITIHVIKNPALTFKQTEAVSTNGLDEVELTFSAVADGDTEAYDFDGLLAHISMPVFSAGNIISAEATGSFSGTFSLIRTSAGKLRLLLQNVTGFKANEPFMKVRLKSYIAPDENDITNAYTVFDAVVISKTVDTINNVYLQSTDTVYNTITGLGVISGEFTDPAGNAFARPVDVKCNGCINTSGIVNTASLNQGNTANQYRFRVIPGQAVTLSVTDRTTDISATGTGDAILSRRFVLNDYSFNTNQEKAGDVDNNAAIDANDVLKIRKNLLLDLYTFTNSYGSVSRYDYFSTSRSGQEGKITGEIINKEARTYDFIAVKLGNVAEYGTPASSSGNRVDFMMSTVTANRNTTVEVPVIAGLFENVAGYQFALGWDPAALEYLGVRGVKHNLLTGESWLNDGKLMVSWLDEAGKNSSRSVGDTLFTLKFQVIGAVGTSSNISFIDHFTPMAAYDQEAAAREVNAVGGGVSVTTGITDLGNGYGIGNATPNPFLTATAISFNLPKQQDVTFTVYNALGQVSSQTINYLSGINNWMLSAPEAMPAGVYTIVITGEGLNHSVKVVKQ